MMEDECRKESKDAKQDEQENEYRINQEYEIKVEEESSSRLANMWREAASYLLLLLYRLQQPIMIEPMFSTWGSALSPLEEQKRLTKMKIAIVSPGNFSVPPVIGSSVEHDIEMVAREMKSSHDVLVYTRTCKEYPRSSQDGLLRYRRFKYGQASFYVKQVIEDIKKEQPDLILIENRPQYVQQMKVNFPQTPLLLNMHSMHFATPPVISKKIAQKAMESIDALITNSHFLKKEYTKMFPTLEGKAYAVHLGIDLAPFIEAQQEEEEIRKLQQKFRIRRKDKVILFAGRLKKEKGVHLLIQSLPRLLSAQKNMKLLIAGSPKYGHVQETPYLKIIKREAFKSRKYILFTGFIKPNQMPFVYQLADIVVSPSIWKEPFCRVNLEAMAAGKPIITTQRGGIPEVVKHDKTGIVLGLKGIKNSMPLALANLLQNHQLAAKLGKNGEKRAKKFTWKRTTDKYVSIFEKIVSN